MIMCCATTLSSIVHKNLGNVEMEQLSSSASKKYFMFTLSEMKSNLSMPTHSGQKSAQWAKKASQVS